MVINYKNPPPSLNVDDMRDLLLSIGEHPSETKSSQLIDTIDVDIRMVKLSMMSFLADARLFLVVIRPIMKV